MMLELNSEIITLQFFPRYSCFGKGGQSLSLNSPPMILAAVALMPKFHYALGCPACIGSFGFRVYILI